MMMRIFRAAAALLLLCAVGRADMCINDKDHGTATTQQQSDINAAIAHIGTFDESVGVLLLNMNASQSIGVF